MCACSSEFLGARTIGRNNNIFARVDTTTLKSDAERVRVESSLHRKEFVYLLLVNAEGEPKWSRDVFGITRR